MATIRRVGFGTVFELEDSKVGIGTDAATHTLQALGNIRSEAATDIGISSLSTYQGFTDKEARFTTGQIDNQSQSGSTSGEIVIDGDVTVSSATTFTSGPQHLTVTDTFTLPSGDTNSRALKPTAGSLRFNQDFATLEFYTGNNWATVNTFTEIQNSPGNRGRAVFNGMNPGKSMVSLEIMTLGTAQDFGDTSSNHDIAGSFSSSTRGIIGGGYAAPADITAIEYVTIASAGDAISFGSLSTSHFRNSGGCSSSTRGLFFAGGHPSYYNTIEYIQINTLGNALDFGDQSTKFAWRRCFASATRGFSTGGFDGPAAPNITTDMVTIAGKGNGTEFGELSVKVFGMGAFANSIKGVYGGGYTPGYAHVVDDIQFFTMASAGSAINFGDLTARNGSPAGASNQVRGIFAGGYLSPGNNSDRAQFITISSGGSAQDFGGLTISTNRADGFTDSHGGLGGF